MMTAHSTQTQATTITPEFLLNDDGALDADAGDDDNTRVFAQ